MYEDGDLQSSYQAYYYCVDLAVGRVDWLVVVVCGLQADSIGFFVESFERCAVIIHPCDNELAVAGGFGVSADNVVAVADVVVDHTVACDLQGEYVVIAAELRTDGKDLVIFDGFDGGTSGDFAD